MVVRCIFTAWVFCDMRKLQKNEDCIDDSRERFNYLDSYESFFGRTDK